ncbi:MAG: GntR family transcriptional regulator [Chitinivibrionales bacterium]|nr:GntR family transcriptional regulator [Chitinivibrionales bacterium]
MKKRSGPALGKALMFVIDMLESGNHMQDTLLPGTDKLSKLAGVSERSMWDAMKKLRKYEIVDLAYGKGFRICPNALAKSQILKDECIKEATADEKESAYAWEKTAEHIKKDILTRHFQSHKRLPSLKELQNRYHVSVSPLRRALNHLCTEGLLTPAGRSFIPAGKAPDHSRNRIVFICLTDIHRQVRLESFTDSFYASLEEECSLAKVKVELNGYWYDEPYDNTGDIYFCNSKRELCPLLDDDSVAGYVFFIGRFDRGEEFVLQNLAHVKKPVAIIDMVGGWKMPWFLKRRNVKVFKMAVSKSLGQSAAQYLLDLGHRHIAYISPFHQSEWSQNRYKGLLETMTTAHADNTAAAYTLNNPSAIHSTYMNEAQRIGHYPSLNKFYKKWNTKLPQEYREVLDPVFAVTIPHIMLAKGEFRRRIRGLFAQALADKKITAWVCANDDVGLEAQQFLKLKEVAVPQRISLLSFDNKAQARQQELTSYMFPVRTAAHMALQFILFRSLFGAEHARTAIAIDGMIIGRQTTGRAGQCK